MIIFILAKRFMDTLIRKTTIKKKCKVSHCLFLYTSDRQLPVERMLMEIIAATEPNSFELNEYFGKISNFC